MTPILSPPIDYKNNIIYIYIYVIKLLIIWMPDIIPGYYLRTEISFPTECPGQDSPRIMAKCLLSFHYIILCILLLRMLIGRCNPVDRTPPTEKPPTEKPPNRIPTNYSNTFLIPFKSIYYIIHIAIFAANGGLAEIVPRTESLD